MAKNILKRLKENPDYFEFWQDLRVYCQDLEIPDQKEFIDALPLLYKRIETDGAGFELYKGLRKFAENKPMEAIDLISLIEEKDSKETLVFAPSLLSGLSRATPDFDFESKILAYLKSREGHRVFAGIDAAYRVYFGDGHRELAFLGKVHDALQNIIQEKDNEQLGGIARFYNKHLKKIPQAKDTIITLLHYDVPSVQGEVARSLNEEFTPEEDLDFFKDCLHLLSRTDVTYKGIYRTIHFRLKDLIGSHPDIIVEYLESWVNHHQNKLRDISILEDMMKDFQSKQPKALSALFFKWLDLDTDTYKQALPWMIADLNSTMEPIGLPKSALEKLSLTDGLYISYMVAGFIHDRKYAAEMLYNILEVHYDKPKIRDFIGAVFVNHLIRNYYSVTDILKRKKKAANDTLKEIIDTIIQASDSYFNRFSELERVNEFEPSDERMQYFLKQQNVQMQRLRDGAEFREPTFLSMLKNIHLKAGKSSFSKYRGEYTQEFEMQHISHSFEVARIQFIDEIGQEKLKIIWQNKTRDELSDQ
ncbi:hypothetical protein [Flagellimonas sp.]|uniref:hypothetical protein n=1 Tax=Flagellimonas sp. TaxID=2058762 RepID=UPI003BAA18BE